jgi:hypothetical protein
MKERSGVSNIETEKVGIAVTSWTFIGEVLGSNLRRDICYPEIFMAFLSN